MFWTPRTLHCCEHTFQPIRSDRYFNFFFKESRIWRVIIYFSYRRWNRASRLLSRAQKIILLFRWPVDLSLQNDAWLYSSLKCWMRYGFYFSRNSVLRWFNILMLNILRLEVMWTSPSASSAWGLTQTASARCLPLKTSKHIPVRGKQCWLDTIIWKAVHGPRCSLPLSIPRPLRKEVQIFQNT